MNQSDLHKLRREMTEKGIRELSELGFAIKTTCNYCGYTSDSSYGFSTERIQIGVRKIFTHVSTCYSCANGKKGNRAEYFSVVVNVL